MKKFSKTILFIIIAIVILGMLSSVLKFKAFAAETPANTNTESTLESPLKGVINSVDELVNLKDDNTLTAEEKIKKEIELRKDALLKIVELSLLETNNLKDKLNAIKTDNNEQEQIKNRLIETLEKNKAYIEQIKTNLENDLLLEEIKDLTKNFKTWREDYYNDSVKKSLAFSLVFQEKSALKTADSRLEKIISDLRKLENAKLIKKEDTKKLLDASIKNLTNAHLLNNKAERSLISGLKQYFAAEDATTTAETLSGEENSLSKNETATSTEVTKVKFEEKDEIKLLVEKSLDEIKNAYKNFLEISIRVKKKLGISTIN